MKTNIPETKRDVVTPPKDSTEAQADETVQQQSKQTRDSQTQSDKMLPLQGYSHPNLPPNPNQNMQGPYYQPPGYPYPAPSSYNQRVIYVQTVPRDVRNSPMYVSGRSSRDENSDPEQLPEWSGFSDQEVRRTFVRRVYIILAIQLIFSLGIILLFILEPHVRNFVRKNSIVYWISLGVFFGLYIGMACSGSLRRKFPMNVILLSIFTIALSCMMGTISSHFKIETVAIAVGICAVVCLVVSLFSFHTKFDFTSCGGILCILLVILLIVGIVSIIIQSTLMTKIYAGLGAMVFMMYLAYDTQMLMGGKTVQISSEEYIFAAMQLYLDIVNIFLFLLLLMGSNTK